MFGFIALGLIFSVPCLVNVWEDHL